MVNCILYIYKVCHSLSLWQFLSYPLKKYYDICPDMTISPKWIFFQNNSFWFSLLQHFYRLVNFHPVFSPTGEYIQQKFVYFSEIFSIINSPFLSEGTVSDASEACQMRLNPARRIWSVQDMSEVCKTCLKCKRHV